MNNNQPKTGEYFNPGGSRKPSWLRGRWQLMIFNEYGQNIQVNHLQRYLKILGTTLAILFLAALCFAALYIHERSLRLDQQRLYTEVQAKVSSLIDENDVLMARLALICEREKDAGENVTEEAQGESPAQKTTPAVKPKEKPVEAPVATVPAPPVVPPAAPTASGPSVGFEDFHFSRRPGTNTVDVAFTVKRTDAGRSAARGRLFVVLMGESDQGDRYLAIPATPLTEDGRPSNPAKGQYFSIKRFKKIEMSAQVENPEVLKQATVLAFTPDGKLLQEDVFPVFLADPDEEETM